MVYLCLTTSEPLSSVLTLESQVLSSEDGGHDINMDHQVEISFTVNNRNNHMYVWE